MAKRILVSVDLAEEEETFKNLMREAEALAGLESAELHVLSVLPTFNMPIVGSHFPEDYEKQTLKAARELLGEKLKARNYAGTLKGHITQGIIYDEIMRVADELKCDLIVLTSTRPEFKNYLLGPNAASVVRHARQSVYVVRSQT